MPSLEEHCRQAEELLGQPFKEVHLWLDEFAGKPPFGMRHRRLRHHLAGIEEARKKFGEKGAMAAKQHIMADLKMEGWTENDGLPQNESDYVRKGLF